jgi:4'-phosphopantetheinyl transferase
MRLLFPWCPPPDRLFLEPGSLHLWRVRLEQPGLTPPAPHSSRLSPVMAPGSYSTIPADLLSLLSPDEQARAARLAIPAKAHDFVIGRARLRQILARYLRCTPTDLAFTYGPQGKPVLVPDGRGDLHFNLAHSGAWMLLAVSNGGPVGVDLEHLDSAFAFAPLAVRYFSPAEQALLSQAPPWRQRRYFYRLWTRKEACLKAMGCGFAAHAQKEWPSGWHTGNLFVRRDFVAAFTVQEGVNSIRRWTWLPPA